MTKAKTNLTRKDPQKGTTPNVPTYDMENTNGINNGDLLLAIKPWTDPERMEGMVQEDQKNRSVTIY